MTNKPNPFATIIIPILLIIPVVWAMLPAGLPNTADGLIHFIRTAELIHGWESGVWLPRWSAHLGYGYGIPLFIYSPPLPYILGGLFHQMGFPLDLAIKLMLLTGLSVSSVGAYLLGRDTLGVMAGTVVAAAYVYAPMRLRELFIQGNAGQFMAWAFLPLAAWGVIRTYQTGQKRYTLAIALGLTGTLLSHNAVALLLALMLALLTLILLLATRNLKRTGWVISGGLTGLVISAWFWLPALLEGGYIQLFRITASDFRDRFIPLAELIALSPPLDTGTLTPYFPLTLGAVQVWLAIFGWLIFLAAVVIRLLYPLLGQSTVADENFVSVQSDPSHTPLAFFLGAFTLFAALMALAWSEPIWHWLPFVDLFEFPARWHGITLVGLAWLGGLGIFYAEKLARPLGWFFGSVALILLLGSAIVNLYPQSLPPGYFQASPADLVRYEVERGIVGTTSLGEFNPVWITRRLRPDHLASDYLAGRPINRIQVETLPFGATTETIEANTETHRFRLDLPVEATLTLNLHYFPGWVASLNGQPLALSPQPETGFISLTIPAGQHQLALNFETTPLRWWANLISILGWLGLIGIIIANRVRSGKNEVEPVATQRISGTVWVSLAGIICLTIGLRAWLPERFKIESPPGQALPAEIPLTVNFADEIQLLGLNPAPTIVKPGDELTVVAFWQALYDLEANYAVFLHLDTPTGQTIATIDQNHPTEIPTSHWPPTLYHRNPLKLTVPANAAPIRYDLRLGLYDAKSGVPLNLAGRYAGQTSFLVGQVWVEQPVTIPENEPALGRFGEAITLHQVNYNPASQTITLYWQTSEAIGTDYSIFLHFLDNQGNLVGQVDGTPYQNQYPTTNWRVGQIIEDSRPLDPDLANVTQFAVGIYSPADGTRLEAIGPAGHPLPNNALVMPLTSSTQ